MANALYIINPAGRGGAGMQTWRDFEERWGKPIREDDVRVTERPGHAREIAERASGGTVCMSPGARLDDGLLDVTIYPNRHRLLMLTQLFPKVPSGAQVDEPDVDYFRSARVEVDCDPPMVVELDGDLFGTTPTSFTVVPQAVRVMCAVG